VQPPLFFSLVSCSYEEAFTVEKYQGVMVKHVPESTTTGDSVKKAHVCGSKVSGRPIMLLLVLAPLAG
jgi:hypothetical protein